ncbi:Dienelactone hydrolase family [Nesidiocoris tenuis]|uniref:Dienelactone hydrolase family n=1 Tax=Nesidiocoris tenuis TaxID=355587 RepID=A0ABN7B937_9HEMI|nr:Dienelactone hydrolase family [Nesidiocoris tenuis]
MGKLCHIFCCPPLPSRIASKLAFGPPPASYAFEERAAEGQTDESARTLAIAFNDTADWMYGERERSKIECVYATTGRGHKIGCVYVRATKSPKFVIAYSHGNAVDVGQMCSFYYAVGCHVGCDVFSYDYAGYGVSGGRPSEKNMYADVEAAWHVLTSVFHVPPERVILYGQSIGTVPTVYLAASSTSPKAVVLHSPFTSGLRLLVDGSRGRRRAVSCCDVFPNIERVPRIACPVLVIHGTHDEIIDVGHAVEIHNSCAVPLAPLFIEGAGHNDLDLYQEYLERIKRLINVELAAV